MNSPGMLVGPLAARARQQILLQIGLEERETKGRRRVDKKVVLLNKEDRIKLVIKETGILRGEL